MRRDRWPWWLMRTFTTLAAVLLFWQAIFAGQFLSGTYPAQHWHRENATVAGITVLVTAVTAAVLRWRGGGPWWPVAAYLGLFGLIAAQIALGFARLLAVHIPLGVTIIAIAVSVCLWSWRARRLEEPTS